VPLSLGGVFVLERDAASDRFIQIASLPIAALAPKPHERGPRGHSPEPRAQVASAIGRDDRRQSAKYVMKHVLRVMTPRGEVTRDLEQPAAIATVQHTDGGGLVRFEWGDRFHSPLAKDVDRMLNFVVEGRTNNRPVRGKWRVCVTCVMNGRV
jgi:hypothetical protein